MVPPMSGLHPQHLQISFTDVGLLLVPCDVDGRRSGGDVVLHRWVTGELEKLLDDEVESLIKEGSAGASIVVIGVAGVLKGFNDSFLLCISNSTLCAHLMSNKIWCTTSLLSIPLEPLSAKAALSRYSTKQAASSTSQNHQASLSLNTLDGGDEVDTEDDVGLETDIEEAPDADEAIPPKLLQRLSLSTSGTRPFWKRSPFAPSAASPASVKLTPPETPTPAELDAALSTSKALPMSSDEADITASRKELDRKVVKECIRELTGLYFSFGVDITNSLQHKHEISLENEKAQKSSKKSSGKEKEEKRGGLREPSSQLPLWRRASKRFFFNRHLITPFIEAGLHGYCTVLQQGFVQETTLSLPLQSYTTLLSSPSLLPPEPTSISLTLLIISRRSTERPGLRYQRRGINPNGGVANFVESEFIITATRDSKTHVASFVQTRGSIPIYWTQSPWALKPPPVLERTPSESLRAMTRHFEEQIRLYGRQVIVNLAERGGKEGVVVDAYREGVEKLGKKDLVKFDFHKECRGMKYENIGKLIEVTKNDLEELGCFWATDEQVFSSQSGVTRTNCIDCLDRTNVVQSAISRFVLNKHLVHLGITTQEEAGMHDSLDMKFNELWANNGDAISNAYAGTSALKGDFTRTGKRNWRGAVNDASNSVARLLQSTVSDFFRQAALDYMLGVNLAAFSEFQERLDISDPIDILRLGQIREEAIETSTASVLLEGEKKLAGWTLLSPIESDQVRSTSYLEKVLLVSTAAVYVCQYEYTLQKVVSFTRIPMGDIVGLQKGPYILSAVDSSGRDPTEHYGFLIRYHPADVTEIINTYSMRIKTSPVAGGTTFSPSQLPRSVSSGSIEFERKFFAFKALRADMIRLNVEGRSQIIDRRESREKGKTAKDTVEAIIEVLRDECEAIGAVDAKNKNWVEEKPIISLSEALAQTSVVDKIQHSLKALIWL